MEKSNKILCSCVICRKECGVEGIHSHYTASHKKENKIELFCEYCNKKSIGQISHKNHVCRCKLNPNRKIEILTESGLNKIREVNKITNLRWDDPNSRILHSIAMQKAVQNNPDSYSVGNRGKAKIYEIDGLKLKGTWEVKFYNWCKLNSIKISRGVGFKYEWNGNRTYFPDFFLVDLNIYVEVKGYEDERDQAKWSQFPHQLCIIRENSIKLIDKNLFSMSTIHENIYINQCVS